MFKQCGLFAALCLFTLLMATPPAAAQSSVYRVQGPIEDLLDSNDRAGDTDMMFMFLGNRMRETLLRPDTLTDLDRIRANADSFKGVEILFLARFHEIGNLFNPFYTHFTPDEYVNFSVWGQNARLWTEAGVLDDFPFCYIRNNNENIDRFLSLQRLDTVILHGYSHASLAGEPWIEVDAFWQQKASLTSDDTRAIRRAEDARAAGDNETAAAIFSRLADAGLPDVMDTYVQTRAAETLLMTGDYRASLRHAKLAKEASPDAEEVANTYDKVVKANAEGGCPGCPPPHSGIHRDGGIGGGLVPAYSGSSATYSTGGSTGSGNTFTPAPPPSSEYVPPAAPYREYSPPGSDMPPSGGGSYVPAPAPMGGVSAHSTIGSGSAGLAAIRTGSTPPSQVPPPPTPPAYGTPPGQPEKDGDQEVLDRPGRGY